jgi:hypothetical protein
MAQRRFSLLLRHAAGALCLALFVFAGLAGCENPSTSPDLAILYPAPNPGPSPTPGDGNMQVQFTKVEGALSYRVYYGTNESDPYGAPSVDIPQPESQLVTVTITGLANGVTYYVWAEARFSDARSELSGPASAAPRAIPASPPAALNVYANTGSLDLTWPLVDNTDSYVVYWSETGGAGAVPPDGAAHAEFSGSPVCDVMGLATGLTNGTSYHVWIRAKNTSGESIGYQTGQGTPLSSVSLGAWQGTLGLTPRDQSLTAVWTAVRGATGYRLYYSTTNDRDTAPDPIPVNAAAGRVSGTITGLANGKSCYVWVTAVNGGTESAASLFNNNAPYAPPPLNINNLSQTIGTAAERFPNEEAGKGDRLSRKQETALADLVADSMHYWAVKFHTNGKGQNKDKIDFAFVNGGVILYALEKGSITNGAVVRMLYRDEMSLLTMTGAQIKTLFHDYVAKVPHSGGGGGGTGAFGQVSSHIRYTIDYHNDARGGEISGLTLNGEPIDNETSYTFVTSTYLLVDNADGYKPILLEGTGRFDSGLIIAQAVAQWIYDQPLPIEPKVDGRIVLKNEVW